MKKDSMDLWTCDDSLERLVHSDRDDAIEDALDGLLAPKMAPAEVLAALPEEITAYGYVRREVSEGERRSLATMVLEELIDHLEEEYGDPDGGGDTDTTDAMKTAARAMVDAVLKDFTVWACDKVHEETVNVLNWVKEHNPEWLEE